LIGGDLEEVGGRSVATGGFNPSGFPPA